MFTIHHIALSVSNIKKSIDFYGLFGFKEVYRWESDNKDLLISHLKLKETFLELFCYKNYQDSPETSKSLQTDLPRIGVKHFGLKVKSIKEIKKLFLEQNISEEININRGRTEIDYFFIKDPDGILLEFVQDDRGL
jgi:glyoxylase I family protein